MASVVEICNRSLDKLGSATITDLADGTKEARACARVYDQVRDAVLRDHPWNFAISRAELAALSEGPAWGFDNQFPWPADCLRVLSIDGTDEWAIEGRAVLTNAGAPLRIRYLRRVEDSAQFDPLFVEALAARMAVELAETLTQSNTKRQVAWEEYREALIRARRADAQESPPQAIGESSWVTARA